MKNTEAIKPVKEKSSSVDTSAVETGNTSGGGGVETENTSGGSRGVDKDIASRLRQLRTMRGLTVRELAKEAKVAELSMYTKVVN